MKVTQRKQN